MSNILQYPASSIGVPCCLTLPYADLVVLCSESAAKNAEAVCCVCFIIPDAGKSTPNHGTTWLALAMHDDGDMTRAVTMIIGIILMTPSVFASPYSSCSRIFSISASPLATELANG